MSSKIIYGFVLSLLSAQTLFAQIPNAINYQGRLVQGSNLVNGQVSLSLSIYDHPTAGSSFCEDVDTVTVVDGIYSTLLGDTTVSGSLTNALTRGNPYLYIEVTVHGVTLSPREKITSTMYSLMAASMPNNSIDGSTIKDGSIDSRDMVSNTFWSTQGNSNISSNYF